MTEGAGLFRPWHVDGAFNLKDRPHCLALSHVGLGRPDCACRAARRRRQGYRCEARGANSQGMADSGSLERLATFRQTLAIFVQDLAGLLKEQDRK